MLPDSLRVCLKAAMRDFDCALPVSITEASHHGGMHLTWDGRGPSYIVSHMKQDVHPLRRTSAQLCPEWLQVAQLFSLPSQPDVVSKLVKDLVAIQLAREPAAPYLMALIQVSTWGAMVC